jgi:restriction endonuclease Mrr
MSDEKEIQEVMQAERMQRTSERQKANLRSDMLRAIKECNEETFMYAIDALGHKPGSEEYKKYQKKFREHVGNRRNP